MADDSASSGDMASEIERAKGLGVIKAVLKTGRIGPIVPLTPTDGLQGQERELPEKALKGRELSHRGTYVLFLKCCRMSMPLTCRSLATSTRPICRRGVRLVDHLELGTIFFHYRSHRMLATWSGERWRANPRYRSSSARDDYPTVSITSNTLSGPVHSG